MSNSACEREYDFSLILNRSVELDDDMVERLYEAGCDDATVGVRAGTPYLTFSRQASSLKEAVFSAIADARKAGIPTAGMQIDDGNLVAQAEIARRIKKSKTIVGQYIRGARGPGGFPRPTCFISDDKPLWMWCDVAFWLRQNNMIREEELEDARFIAAVNLTLEYQLFRENNSGVVDEVTAFLAK